MSLSTYSNIWPMNSHISVFYLKIRLMWIQSVIKQIGKIDWRDVWKKTLMTKSHNSMSAVRNIHKRYEVSSIINDTVFDLSQKTKKKTPTTTTKTLLQIIIYVLIFLSLREIQTIYLMDIRTLTRDQKTTLFLLK